jgi:hypothetical protein
MSCPFKVVSSPLSKINRIHVLTLKNLKKIFIEKIRFEKIHLKWAIRLFEANWSHFNTELLAVAANIQWSNIDNR